MAISNSGMWPAGIDYIFMSGDYVDGKYSTDLALNFGTEKIDLCQKLMRGDKWKLGRWGDVLHSYETEFPKTANQQAIDLQGHFSVGTGGMAYQACQIGPGGYMMVPFYGPIPSSQAPYMELDVLAVSGGCTISYALAADLSDMVATNSRLKVGLNKIRLPTECIGEDYIAVGIDAGDDGWITLSRFYTEVQRHISENILPVMQPGNAAEISISDAEQSNHTLKQLYLRYRDIY